jgi:antibiotic biosynthesis monooxygenase (ABM) superfamily enzyme
MADRYVRIVSLWIHPGQEAAFEAFEREAARIMAKHRGRIDSAVRLALAEGAGAKDKTPYELHIVSFPDRAAADSFASDPETLALREKRGQIIARTEQMAGREAGPY